MRSGAFGSAIAFAVGLTIMSALSATPADAAIRRGTDRDASMRFVLDGRVLNVRLLANASAADRRRVQGRRIRAACGTDFNFSRGVRVRQTRTWGSERTRLRFTFARDISRRARWCLLEYPRGGDVAFVNLPG